MVNGTFKNLTQNANIDTKWENNAQKGHILQMAGNDKLHLGQCRQVHVQKIKCNFIKLSASYCTNI